MGQPLSYISLSPVSAWQKCSLLHVTGCSSLSCQKRRNLNHTTENTYQQADSFQLGQPEFHPRDASYELAQVFRCTLPVQLVSLKDTHQIYAVRIRPGVFFLTCRISLHILFVASGVFLLHCFAGIPLAPVHLPRKQQVWMCLQSLILSI